MAHAISRRCSSRPLEGLLPIGRSSRVVAGGAGLAISAAAGSGVLAGIEGGLAAAGIYVAVLAVVRRAVVLDTIGLIGGAVRSGLARELH